MTAVIEIRTYRLKVGSRSVFHDLVRDSAVPLVHAAGGDVVAFGPCFHDDNAYVLIRRYDNVGDLARDQDAFYSSEAWRLGPREAILSLIDYHVAVVLEADDQVIEALRTLGSKPIR